MNEGSLIYTILTLLAVFFFLMSPVLKKVFKSVDATKQSGTSPGEDRMYESVDSKRVVARSLVEIESKEEQAIREYPSAEDTEPMVLHSLTAREQSDSAVRRVEALSSLKKAVVWKEILDPPAGWRE